MVLSRVSQRVEVARQAMGQAVAELDPDLLSPYEAGRLLEAFDQVVRTATAASTLLARRVEDGQEWRRAGFGSAAEWLAAKSGSSLGSARRKMETSKALKDLPGTRAEMAKGSISAEQGETIAAAAKVNPGAEERLLRTAKGGSNLNELRHQALRAKAEADRGSRERHSRLHRERRVRRYTDGEGARHLDICGPVDAVSVIEGELDRRLSAVIRRRPAGERLESRDALAFDAMAEMARRSQTADEPANDRAGRRQPVPQHLALLRLDVEALWRGHVEGDELCEVAGLGPIPVEAARRLLGDAVLKLIITKGDAVAHITSLTRGPTQAMRYALLWTSPTCTAEGCTRTIVEHDHRFGAEFKDTRHTRLDELDRLCHSHHDLHTLHGWALVDGAGKRAMVPPDHPRHPSQRAGCAEQTEARGGPAGDRAQDAAGGNVGHPTPASRAAAGPHPPARRRAGPVSGAGTEELRTALNDALVKRARAVPGDMQNRRAAQGDLFTRNS